MKKLVVVVPAMLAAASAIAAEGDMPDSQAVSAIFTNAQASLGDLLTAALHVIIPVVGGGLLVWASISIVRDIKRAFYSGLASDGDGPDSGGDEFWSEEDEAGYQEYLERQKER